MRIELLDITLALLAMGTLGNVTLTLALVRRVNGLYPTSLPAAKGLKPGEAAPDFTAEKLDGSTLTLADLSSRRTAMVFISPGCNPCEEAVPEYLRLATLARRKGDEFLIVSSGGLEPTRAMVGEGGTASATVIIAPRANNDLFANYKAGVTPMFTVIENGRVVAAGMPLNTNQEWTNLIARWAGEPERDQVTRLLTQA